MRTTYILFFALSLWSGLVQAGSGLIGAWQLLRVDTVRANGQIIHPFYGEHPAGLIVYDASGWMSVQIVSDPKPTVPKGDSRDAFRGASAAEKAIAADGYYAYFGPYTVDEPAQTVTHHIREALYPGERGSDFVRHFAIKGDELTLVAKLHEMGEDRERHLVWRRLQASSVVPESWDFNVGQRCCDATSWLAREEQR